MYINVEYNLKVDYKKITIILCTHEKSWYEENRSWRIRILQQEVAITVIHKNNDIYSMISDDQLYQWMKSYELGTQKCYHPQYDLLNYQDIC